MMHSVGRLSGGSIVATALRAAALAAVIALVAVVLPARAQEGGTPAPPPPDSTALDAPAPQSPESGAPAAPANAAPATAVAPGVGGEAAFWGDSTGTVLPPLAEVRSAAELDVDYEASKALRAGAESRMLKARERSLRWKAQVETQKSKVSAISKQLDAARKEKREGDKKDLELSKQREEKKRDYCDSMRLAQEYEADFRKAQFEYAGARMSGVEQERRLSRMWAGGGYEVRVSAESRTLEQSVLTQARERANLLSNVASRERALADKRLDALKVWGELPR